MPTSTYFIACAQLHDAPASEFSSLGRINVLKARMNVDLHMAEDLKNTARATYFVIFGEPDVDAGHARPQHPPIMICKRGRHRRAG